MSKASYEVKPCRRCKGLMTDPVKTLGNKVAMYCISCGGSGTEGGVSQLSSFPYWPNKKKKK